MMKNMIKIFLVIFLLSNKAYALDNKLNISSINYQENTMINLSNNINIDEVHSVGIGKTLRLYATMYGNCDDGSCLTTNKYLKIAATSLNNVEWKSSDEDVATVNSNGIVTGKREGISTITATYGNQEATYTIIVNTYLGDINKNSIVNLEDAKLIAKYIIDKDGIDEDDLLVADYNNDGNLKMNDVVKLIRKTSDNWVNNIDNTISSEECVDAGKYKICPIDIIDTATLKVLIERKTLKDKQYQCLDNYPYNCKSRNNCECESGVSYAADRNFYITHIWVADPYNQINTKLVDKDEQNIFRVGELVHEGNNGEPIESSGKYTKTTDNKITYQVIPSKNLETITANYENIVAINASAQSGAMLNPYLVMGDNIHHNIFKNDTSEALLDGSYINTIDDTTNVRYYYSNSTILDVSDEYIYYISKDGILSDIQFKYASINDANKEDYNENIRNYYNIVRNDPKYTFSFKSPLIRNGNGILSDSELNNKGMRQIFCQIDKNNFIILTNEYYPGDVRPYYVGTSGGLTPENEDDRKAYYDARVYGILSYRDAINELQGFGCKTAVNLDGGGSVALLMRKNGKASVISGDNRVTPDILYFHE